MSTTETPTKVGLVFCPGQSQVTLPRLAVTFPLRPMEGELVTVGPASQVANLLTTLMMGLYQSQRATPEEATALFARTFLGTSVHMPEVRVSNPDAMPLDVDFLLQLDYEYELVGVGDKQIFRPEFIITATRPIVGEAERGDGVKEGVSLLPFDDESYDASMRGVLSMTMDQGTPLITAHKGWIGSNEVVEHLRLALGAAVV